MLMCIENLVKFCPLVLKILSGNEMVTDLRIIGITEGQGKSNIAPTFSKRGYNYAGIKYEPRSEKTSLWGFPPGLTQTGMYSHRR